MADDRPNTQMAQMARGLSIYEQGRPRELDNHRPSSLLTELCKVSVVLLANRLMAALAEYLLETRYECRPGRRIAQRTTWSGREPRGT